MDNLVVSTMKKFKMDKFLSQVKLVANSSVKKILSVKANAMANSCDASNGVACVGGKIVVDIVYLSVDGNIEVAQGSCDFIEKQRTTFSLTDCFAKIGVSEQNSNFSSNEILCSVALDVEILGGYKYEIPAIDNTAGSFVLSKTSFDTLKLEKTCEDNFVIAEEVETTIENMEVLSSKAGVLVADVSCTVDKVVVEGKVCCEVVYRSGEEFGLLNKIFDFKQEILAEGTVPNMVADSNIIIKTVNVTPEISDGKNSIVYAIDLFAKCYVFDECSYEIASDMFSLKNELTTTYDYFSAKNSKGFVLGNDTISSVTDISNVFDLDDVLGVFDAKASVGSVEFVNEKLIANLKISAYALCKTQTGFDRSDVMCDASIEIDNPENLALRDLEMLCEISSYKVKAGKDLEVIFKVEYQAKFDSEVTQKFVKSYEEKEEKSQNSYGIKVYVARAGQTVFDVAKILNVTPAQITSQNQVEDVFEQGEKIYVYSPVNLA